MKNAYSLLMRLNCKHVKMCMGKKTAFLPKTNMHNYHTKYLVKSQVYFTTFCPICKEGKVQKKSFVCRSTQNSFSCFYYFEALMLACAAANHAIGTLNGEHET